MEFNAIQLIRVVRDLPQLYDASMPEFKVPINKDLAWRKIAHKMKLDEDECRKRWRTLRERYTRELKRLKSNGKSQGVSTGTLTGAVSPSTVNWCYFDEMSFLQSHVRLRRHRYKFNTKKELLEAAGAGADLDDLSAMMDDDDEDNSLAYEIKSEKLVQDGVSDGVGQATGEVATDANGVVGGGSADSHTSTTVAMEVEAMPNVRHHQVPASTTIQLASVASQQQQQSSGAVGGGQPVYAKFKVHSIGGQLLNDEYAQLQTVTTVKDADGTVRQAIVPVDHHHHHAHGGAMAAGTEYIIINGADCTSMSVDEHGEVHLDQLEEVQTHSGTEDGDVGTGDDNASGDRNGAGGPTGHDDDEALDDDDDEEDEEDVDELQHDDEEDEDQQQIMQHLQFGRKRQSAVLGKSSTPMSSNTGVQRQRLILTAPRDDHSPPPLAAASGHDHQHHLQQQQFGGGTTATTAVISTGSSGVSGGVLSTSAKRKAKQLHDELQHHYGGKLSGRLVESRESSGSGEECAQMPPPNDEHEIFGQAVAASLRQLNRLHTVRAKVEIYRVLEKFVELEERSKKTNSC